MLIYKQYFLCVLLLHVVTHVHVHVASLVPLEHLVNINLSYQFAVIVCICDFPLFRFIRGKVSFADQSERENPPKGLSVVNMLYGSKALRDAYSSIVKLYEAFVGPSHFRVMSRLLGYRGIAMILE